MCSAAPCVSHVLELGSIGNALMLRMRREGVSERVEIDAGSLDLPSLQEAVGPFGETLDRQLSGDLGKQRRVGDRMNKQRFLYRR